MTLQLCLSIIGAVTGITGSAIGIFGILHNRFLAVHQYMESLEAPDFIAARARIYNQSPNQALPMDSKDASLVVNFFHHWGLLAKKHYLPLWVFDSGSGTGVIRLYELTQGYIMNRRQIHNDSIYASNFEWLYHELQRRRIRKKW